jgi:hypothetical protein
MPRLQRALDRVLLVCLGVLVAGAFLDLAQCAESLIAIAADVHRMKLCLEVSVKYVAPTDAAPVVDVPPSDPVNDHMSDHTSPPPVRRPTRRQKATHDGQTESL